MNYSPFRRVQTTDPTINRIQDNITTATRPIASLVANPASTPNLLTQVQLLASPGTSSGYNEVKHMLGKALTGWQVVRWHGGWAQVYDQQDNNILSPTSLLYLVTSANVTIDILVF